MNEIFIFVLGNIVGGLFMTVMMCVFQISKTEVLDDVTKQM